MGMQRIQLSLSERILLATLHAVGPDIIPSTDNPRFHRALAQAAIKHRRLYREFAMGQREKNYGYSERLSAMLSALTLGGALTFVGVSMHRRLARTEYAAAQFHTFTDAQQIVIEDVAGKIREAYRSTPAAAA